jgi:hypothetical protein
VYVTRTHGGVGGGHREVSPYPELARTSVMPYAINIRSDNDSSEPIRALWKICGALEDRSSMEALQYPPHITFAVYDDIDLGQLFDVFDWTFRGLSSVTVRFAKLGYFEAPRAIILGLSRHFQRVCVSFMSTYIRG